MDALKLSVPVRGPIAGAELGRKLKSIILPENLSYSEKRNKSGSALGKFFMIHYSEFGPYIVMTLSVGEPAEAVICDEELYDKIWIEVTKLPGVKQEDFLKDLNGPRDIVSQCQNVRDACEKAFAYIN